MPITSQGTARILGGQENDQSLLSDKPPARVNGHAPHCVDSRLETVRGLSEQALSGTRSDRGYVEEQEGAIEDFANPRWSRQALQHKRKDDPAPAEMSTPIGPGETGVNTAVPSRQLVPNITDGHADNSSTQEGMSRLVTTLGTQSACAGEIIFSRAGSPFSEVSDDPSAAVSQSCNVTSVAPACGTTGAASTFPHRYQTANLAPQFIASMLTGGSGVLATFAANPVLRDLKDRTDFQTPPREAWATLEQHADTMRKRLKDHAASADATTSFNHRQTPEPAHARGPSIVQCDRARDTKLIGPGDIPFHCPAVGLGTKAPTISYALLHIDAGFREATSHIDLVSARWVGC
jgi:hypothetical protein